MRSTAVNDVSSAFLNQAVSAAGKTVAGNGDFHTIWSSQMNKGTLDTAVSDTSVQKQNGTGEQQKKSSPEDSLAQDDAAKTTEEVQPVNQRDQNTVSESRECEDSVSDDKDAITETVTETETETEPGSNEEWMQAMEVVGTAVVQLMEQITDTFGVTMEELKTAMDDLGISQTDLFDASKLGSVLLELGGASDAYALLTDGTLYDNYQTIMEQMGQVLQESAGKLGTDEEQIVGLLKGNFDSMPTAQEENVLIVPVQEETENPEEGVVLTVEENTSMYSGMTADAVQEEQAAPKQDAGEQTRNGRQSESRTERGDELNIFSQNLKMEQFRPELQQTQELSQSSPWNSDTRQIMEQILDYMKLSLNADATSLEMQLHPASLGTLQIQIASKAGVVTANFIAQNETVKAALESQMIQLREQFEEQGVRVEAIEVTVQTHEFEQNLEQGRGRSQQEIGKKGRSRRINVSGMFAADDPETDEMMAVDMVTAGGSTVSYTA